jgi:hypothetical protein
MKRFYSLKHAKEETEKLAKCGEHENGKILASYPYNSPLLIKENNNKILQTRMTSPEYPVIIQKAYEFSDTYRELPSGTTVVFTQDSLS